MLYMFLDSSFGVDNEVSRALMASVGASARDLHQDALVRPTPEESRSSPSRIILCPLEVQGTFCARYGPGWGLRLGLSSGWNTTFSLALGVGLGTFDAGTGDQET